MTSPRKKRRSHRPALFAIPGVTMILIGFGLMLSVALGGRLDSAAALPLPVGFTTAAAGAMLLTRTPLAVFFFLIYTLAGLVLSIREFGWLHFLPFVFVALAAYSLPLARHARA